MITVNKKIGRGRYKYNVITIRATSSDVARRMTLGFGIGGAASPSGAAGGGALAYIDRQAAIAFRFALCIDSEQCRRGPDSER